MSSRKGRYPPAKAPASHIDRPLHPGALFTSLAPSTIALASYFCVADLILISQCTYYNTLNARRRRAAAARREHHRHHHHTHRRSSTGDDDLGACSSSAAPLPPTESDPLLTANNNDNTNGGLPGSHRRHELPRRVSSTSGDALARIITGEDDTPDSRPWLHNTLSLVAVWAVGVAGWFVSYKMGAWATPGGGGGGEGGGDEGMAQEPTAVVGMVLGYASAVCYLW